MSVQPVAFPCEAWVVHLASCYLAIVSAMPDWCQPGAWFILPLWGVGEEVMGGRNTL